MGGSDERRDLSERRRGVQDALADHGVGADQRPFIVVERTGLAEHARGDRDFTDIVQLAGPECEIEHFGVESEPARDVAGELPDLKHVLVEVG
jgi:hypothetical protein